MWCDGCACRPCDGHGWRAALWLHLKTSLAAHECARNIHFVGDLPLTATGKVIGREPGEYIARAAWSIFGTTMFCKAQIFD
jgi:hypothetical protein